MRTGFPPPYLDLEVGLRLDLTPGWRVRVFPQPDRCAFVVRLHRSPSPIGDFEDLVIDEEAWADDTVRVVLRIRTWVQRRTGGVEPLTLDPAPTRTRLITLEDP